MILRFNISPPFAHLTGDRYYVQGHELQQERASVVIQTRTYETYFSTDRKEITELVGGSSIDRFYLEKRMPGTNVSNIKVQENQTTGSVTFSFSDGENTELPDWAAAGAIADEVDASTEIGRKIIIGKAFRASPDGANKTNQVGAAVSLNLQASVPVDYTPPV